jgi:hypothetical protein
MRYRPRESYPQWQGLWWVHDTHKPLERDFGPYYNEGQAKEVADDLNARAHRVADPHCTCPDCIAYHAEHLEG